MNNKLLDIKLKIFNYTLCFVLVLFSFSFFCFNKIENVMADSVLTHDGFYVLKGAQLRVGYDIGDDIDFTGLRYSIGLTKEQYNAYILDYNSNLKDGSESAECQSWYFYVQLGFKEYLGEFNQKGTPIMCHVAYDIHSHFEESDDPYIFYIGLSFDETVDGISKSNYELFKMFSKTEVYINYIGLDIDGDVYSYPNGNFETSLDAWNSTKGNIEYSKTVRNNEINYNFTNRSVRSLVLSFFVRGVYSFEEMQRYLLNENGEKMERSNIRITDSSLIYDINNDSITINVGADKLSSVQKVYFNSTPIDFVIDGDNAIISGVTSKVNITSGNTYCINFDTMNSVYSYSNVLVN